MLIALSYTISLSPPRVGHRAGPRLLLQRELELNAALGRLGRGARQRHDAP